MNEDFIGKLDRIILYVVIYTAVFLTFYLTMPYILPFVFGGIIALMAQRPINFITKRVKIKRGFVGLIVVLVIFAVICSILVAIIAKIVNELISLSSVLPELFNQVRNFWDKNVDMIESYYHTLDPALIDSIRTAANKIFSGSFTAAVFLVNFALNVLKSLPGMLMLILFTLLSAVYLAIDLPKLKEKFFSMMTKRESFRARNVVVEANKMLLSYLMAYLILITLTFIETFIATNILKIRYGLLISIITSISDLLPVLGPGTVLIPTGTILILTGNYIQGIGIYITYIVILVVRQTLEPKIVSSSLGVYPLAIVIAIFVGIKSFGLIGMIFTVFMVIFYVVLQKVGVL